MAIIVTCKCGVQFQAMDEHAGMDVTCPGCGRPLVIPGSGGFVQRKKNSPSTSATSHLPIKDAEGKSWNGLSWLTSIFLILFIIAGPVIAGGIYLIVWRPAPNAKAKTAPPPEPEPSSTAMTFDQANELIGQQLGDLEVVAARENELTYEQAREKSEKWLREQLLDHTLQWKVKVQSVTKEEVNAIWTLEVPNTVIVIVDNRERLQIDRHISGKQAIPLAKNAILDVAATVERLNVVREPANGTSFVELQLSEMQAIDPTVTTALTVPDPGVQAQQDENAQDGSPQNKGVPIPAHRKHVADGIELLAANDYRQAIREFESALQTAPAEERSQITKYRDQATYQDSLQTAKAKLDAGQYEEAIGHFSQAIDIRPASVEAVEGIATARQKAGYRGAPYHEPFVNVVDAGLPVGWTGDSSIGVKHGGGFSWLQPMSEGTFQVATPPLVFPGDFELELCALLDQGASLRMTLADSSLAPLVQTTFRNDWGNCDFGFGETPAQSRRETGNYFRARLVRDEDALHLFVKDQEALSRVVTSSANFHRVTFALDGGRRVARLADFELRPHPKNEDRHHLTPFEESFQTVKEGGLPVGWDGSASIRVTKEGGVHCVEAAGDGMHLLRTPPLNITGDFELELQMTLARSQVEIALEGSGNTPDLILSLSGDRYRNTVTAQYTGTYPQTAQLPSSTTCPVRLVRDGQTFRLSIAGNENLISDRKPNVRDFRRVALRIQGQPYPARLYKLAIRPPGTPEVVTSKTPDDETGPETGPLSGVWRATNGSVYQLRQMDDQILLSVTESPTMIRCEGALARTSEKRWETWHGTQTAVFKEDPVRTPRAMNTTIRKIQDNKLYVMEDRLIWDTTGREIRRSDGSDRFHLIKEAELE